VALALQADLPLHPEGASKAERGYRLAANPANTGAGQGRRVPLQLGMTSIAVFRSTAFSCLSQLQGNERGARETDAPASSIRRASIRRLRSAIRLWKPLLPVEYVSNFDPRWRTLAGQLGDTRNWDVFLTEILPPISKAFPDHPDVQRLAKQAASQLAACRKAAQAAIASPDYSQLLLEFTAATIALPESKKPRSPFCPTLAEQARQAVAALAPETKDSNPEARHALRIRAEATALRDRVLCPAVPGPTPAALSPECGRTARPARPDERLAPSPNSSSCEAFRATTATWCAPGWPGATT
jgi:triphosphatase